MLDSVPTRTGWTLPVVLLTLAAAVGLEQRPVIEPALRANSLSDAPAPTVAKGVTVTELDEAIFYIYQAKDQTYWFGSDQRGVYHYTGKTLTNFTTKDGLVSNRIRGIQEDKAGNIYFNSYEGISKFDGQVFTTLSVSPAASSSGWKSQPDDLWFVGAQDTGAVYRYDGTMLHRLTLPRTPIGEAQTARFPRSKFPNAIWSPYDVYTITRDRQGNLWFGTASAGACRFDGKSFSWLYEPHLTETEAGGSFGIRAILEDKTGAYWICNTRDRFRIDGNHPFDPRTGRINYRTEQGIDPTIAPEGTDRIYFMSIVEDPKGALWMATVGDGVWRYDGERVTRFAVMDGTDAATLFSIYRDNLGNFWLGTHHGGAYRFNGEAFEKFQP